MHEPNLQNVAKDFILNIGMFYFYILYLMHYLYTFFLITDSFVQTVSCRSAFKVNPDRMLISADFCQLEMRILTHLCEDPTLMHIMQSQKDVFILIAAKWNQIAEDRVSFSLKVIDNFFRPA